MKVVGVVLIQLKESSRLGVDSIKLPFGAIESLRS